MSLGAGAYKVGGAEQCFSMRKRYPWKPFGRPPPGTVTLRKSVEYLPTNTQAMTYLTGPDLKRKGGMGKTQHKMASKQQAIATTLCE